jgi:Putative prokaryotic signal transducing protein
MPSRVVGVSDRPVRMAPVDSDNRLSKLHGDGVVELTRVQPIEAEVIVARLRASGIPAMMGADSVYPSVTIADGIPVFVSEEDAARARALLEDDDKSQ